MQRTQLCLIVTAEAGAGARERLEAALAAAPIASVIIGPGSGRRLDAASAGPLVAIAQKANAAALILEDARLAGTIAADGVHLSPGADYATARDILGRGAIVGGDAGGSRHAAMSLGEAGADYVGFGVPVAVEEQDEARACRLELIAWWAEIFEPPCMALDVDTPEEAARLARAGADFVAMPLMQAMPIADVRDLVAGFADAIGAGAVAAGGRA